MHPSGIRANKNVKTNLAVGEIAKEPILITPSFDGFKAMVEGVRGRNSTPMRRRGIQQIQQLLVAVALNQTRKDL